jgi:hypothetical protein
MRERSYAVVELSRVLATDVARLLQDDGPAFFRRAAEEKRVFAQPEVDEHGCPAYRGYFAAAGVREILFLRPRHDGTFGHDGQALHSIDAAMDVTRGLPDPCREHVDYTLLTMIPLGCQPGLTVLDLSTMTRVRLMLLCTHCSC